MAYEIGTASNYKDLLDRLRLFATDPGRVIGSADTDIDELDPIDAADAWTVKRWDTDFDGAGGYELVLSGPGVTGSDGILVAIQTWEDTINGAYNWALNGYTAYSDLLEFLTQLGSVSTSYGLLPQVLLNNSSISYWFFANGRRICGVAKVGSTYYATFYLGYYLPYGTPNAFPYPLMIGGSAAYNATDEYNVYTCTQATNMGFPNAYHKNEYNDNVEQSSLVVRGAVWYSFGNYSSDTQGSLAGHRGTWPHIHSDSDDLSWYFSPDPSGAVPLFPIILMMTTPQVNTLGEFDGIRACLCDTIVSEDMITYDGDTYIVFQNGLHTNSINKFAIKKA